MTQRWMCAALLDTEKRALRTPGYRWMGILMTERQGLTTVEKPDGLASESKTAQYSVTEIPPHLEKLFSDRHDYTWSLGFVHDSHKITSSRSFG